MNVFIINCFDTYEDRVDSVYSFFRTKGYNTTVLQSNFKHISKVKRVDEKDGYIFLDTKRYRKNLSYARMKSHYLFAKDVFSFLDTKKVDLLYIIFPPNSLGKFLVDYKKKNIRCKVIIDIMDLWPETLPLNIDKNFFPFNKWKAMRDETFYIADYVIAECDLYREVLQEVVPLEKTKTIYLSRKNDFIDKKKVLSDEYIDICYLGSINNIIDIDFISKVLYELNNLKKIRVHIIGDGEQRAKFVNVLVDLGIEVKFYGKIYDLKKKRDIFEICHLGLNIMKESVCVGLSMKSIEYFESGLPILNNIKHDTWKLLKEYKSGFNISDENISLIVKKLSEMKREEFIEMGYFSRKVYEDKFSCKVFNERLENVIEKIL